MRTTVDLEPDLLQRLRIEAVKRRLSFKQLLNTVIRGGLAARPASSAKAYVLPVSRLGAVREGVDLTKALRLVDELENAEVAEEMDRRK